jgi:hypothetical protein
MLTIKGKKAFFISHSPGVVPKMEFDLDYYLFLHAICAKKCRTGLIGQNMRSWSARAAS